MCENHLARAFEMSMTVLLFGGTGAIGDYLRERLAAKGVRVIVTTRRNRPSEPGIQFIRGNAHDNSFAKDVLAATRPDAVVDFMNYPTAEFAARRDFLLLGTGHYLFLSSYRVFADAMPLVESSPRLLDCIDDPEYLKTDEYALRKARSENLLRDSPSKNWTILRPSITFSKARFQLGCLEADTVVWRALHGVPVPIPSAMLNRLTSLTWAGDTARLISCLIGNTKAFGEAFNLATAESLTWRDVADIYHDTIDLETVDINIESYMPIIGRAKTLYDRMYDRVLDNTKICQAIGITQSEFANTRTTLSRELKNFVASGRLLAPNIRQNALLDRACGTRIPMKSLSRHERFIYWRTCHPWAERVFTDRRIARLKASYRSLTKRMGL